MALVKYRDWVQIGLVWLDEFTRADFRINFVYFFLVQHSTKNTCVCCKFDNNIYSVYGLCVHQGKSAWMVD